MGKLSENGQRVLVYVSGPSPGFVTCYSFIINKRGDLGPETKRSAETAGVGLYCVSELLSCWLLIQEKLILKCSMLVGQGFYFLCSGY